MDHPGFWTSKGLRCIMAAMLLLVFKNGFKIVLYYVLDMSDRQNLN
jgi:hypothetical protein